MQSSRENNDDNGNDNDDRQWVIRRWETHREWWGGVEQSATHRQFEIATFNCVFAGKNNAHTHTHSTKIKQYTVPILNKVDTKRKRNEQQLFVQQNQGHHLATIPKSVGLEIQMNAEKEEK